MQFSHTLTDLHRHGVPNLRRTTFYSGQRAFYRFEQKQHCDIQYASISRQLTAASFKDIFVSVDNQNIVGFIEYANFYH